MKTKRALPLLPFTRQLMISREFRRTFAECEPDAQSLLDYVSSTESLWEPIRIHMRQMAAIRFERYGKMDGPITIQPDEDDPKLIAVRDAAYFVLNSGVMVSHDLARAAMIGAWVVNAEEEALESFVGNGLTGRSLGIALQAALDRS